MPTMQHEVYRNPNQRGRVGFPYIVSMQADVAASETTVIAPLTGFRPHTPILRVLPHVEIEGQRYLVVLTLMTNVPTRLLRQSVGSLAAWRDDLTRGLDWVFFGI